MLTIADGGGRGVQEPLILADVICEQPLIRKCHHRIGPKLVNTTGPLAPWHDRLLSQPLYIIHTCAADFIACCIIYSVYSYATTLYEAACGWNH